LPKRRPRCRSALWMKRKAMRCLLAFWWNGLTGLWRGPRRKVKVPV